MLHSQISSRTVVAIESSASNYLQVDLAEFPHIAGSCGLTGAMRTDQFLTSTLGIIEEPK
jgi:hypothetical protein